VIVGFLFCADKDELMASPPPLRPAFHDRRLSLYDDLAAVGRDEDSDPYHYGLSLLLEIQARERHENGTHTFSHFCCLAEGRDVASFRADLAAAQEAAARRGIRLTSIVFPRNQVTPQHLQVRRDMGLTAFRGNEQDLFRAASRGSEQNPLRRAFRLADNYLPIARVQVQQPVLTEGLVDVASSRFLRSAGVSRRACRHPSTPICN